MNSPPLSVSRPASRNERAVSMSSRAWITQRWARLRRILTSVQPVATQVTSSVCAYSPRASPPSWATRSASQNPGEASSHSAKVRIAIWRFNRLPGLVPERPFSFRRARSETRRRSIVAADIARSCSRTRSEHSSSPWRCRACTVSAITGARRLPAGPSKAAHTTRSRDDLAVVGRGAHRTSALPLGPEGLAKGPSCVIPVPVAELTELVQDLGLLGPGCSPVALRELARDGLALDQREPHLPPPPGAHARPGWRSTRAYSGEATGALWRAFLVSQLAGLTERSGAG